jgi:hypothetical protein
MVKLLRPMLRFGPALLGKTKPQSVIIVSEKLKTIQELRQKSCFARHFHSEMRKKRPPLRAALLFRFG